MLVFPKDHVLEGPSGQGYKLTRDVFVHDIILDTDFEPLGSAPVPKMGEIMPDWLVTQIYPEPL